ncbi:mobile mystery protein A [bacterium SCSIO 12741]|nr:mobile mystery protein A [bacterium SCSIO 12741]
MRKNKLQIEQLEFKMKILAPALQVSQPPTGWIKATRLALGMSLRQLAQRLFVTKQSLQELEQREKEGNITLKSLRDAAEALDMDLVYGFVPKDGSIDAMIEKRAQQMAMHMMAPTSHRLKLDDPENFEANLQNAIEERVTLLKYKLPRNLWD